MTDLLKLTPLVRTIAILLGLVGLLSQSLLMYFLQPLPRFQNPHRKLLEGMILVLLVLLEGVLIEKIRLDPPSGPNPERNLFFLVFGGLFLVLALRRALDLLPETIREKREQITEYSIQEALDSLEEGVLITLQNGEPVLMNRALFRYTESILGTGAAVPSARRTLAPVSAGYGLVCAADPLAADHQRCNGTPAVEPVPGCPEPTAPAEEYGIEKNAPACPGDPKPGDTPGNPNSDP